MSEKKTPSFRIVGIDYGIKRVGIALSDPMRIIANKEETLQALPRLENTVEKVLQQIDALQKKYGDPINEIVVGLPLRMDGTHSHITDEVSLFIEELKKRTDKRVIAWDERLSSVQADRSLREAKFTRKKRAKKVDSVAAIIILQSYLSSLTF